MSIPQDDNRVFLTIGDKHFLSLRNVVTDAEECFEIVDKDEVAVVPFIGRSSVRKIMNVSVRYC